MRGLAIGLLCGAALGGCRKEAPLPLPRQTFVEVMVELRRAGTPPSDPQAFPAKQAEILKRHGVTEAQLRQYAQVAARDPEALAETYDTINARLRRAGGQDAP